MAREEKRPGRHLGRAATAAQLAARRAIDPVVLAARGKKGGQARAAQRARLSDELAAKGVPPVSAAEAFRRRYFSPEQTCPWTTVLRRRQIGGMRAAAAYLTELTGRRVTAHALMREAWDLWYERFEKLQGKGSWRQWIAAYEAALVREEEEPPG